MMRVAAPAPARRVAAPASTRRVAAPATGPVGWLPLVPPHARAAPLASTSRLKARRLASLAPPAFTVLTAQARLSTAQKERTGRFQAPRQRWTAMTALLAPHAPPARRAPRYASRACSLQRAARPSAPRAAQAATKVPVVRRGVRDVRPEAFAWRERQSQQRAAQEATRRAATKARAPSALQAHFGRRAARRRARDAQLARIARRARVLRQHAWPAAIELLRCVP